MNFLKEWGQNPTNSNLLKTFIKKSQERSSHTQKENIFFDSSLAKPSYWKDEIVHVQEL